MKKIVFTSGGTGGHILPAIHLMKHLSKKGYQTILVTDYRGKSFLKNEKEIKSFVISADTPSEKNFFIKIISLFKIFFSIISSILILRKEKPNLIIGFGGYVSFPISFSSIFFKTPLMIYENNLVLGRTNKKLLKISKRVLVGTKEIIDFPKRYKDKIYEVGNILREEIINYNENKKDFNINKENELNLVVLGGSQGAEIFGEIVPHTINALLKKGFKVKINQQCLESQKEKLVKFYRENNIDSNVFTFTDKILDLISSSDIAISRCGASTTAELMHTSTPFIAVPYPFSMDNHQYYNAKFYEEKGCCWVIEQTNFNLKNLQKIIENLLINKKIIKETKTNMKKYASKDVYTKVENVIGDFFINEN